MMRNRIVLLSLLAAVSISAPPLSGAASPADPNASATTQAVLNYLSGLPNQLNHRLISGQFVDSRATLYDDAIFAATGQHVGLIGDDYYPYGGGTPELVSTVNPPLLAMWQAGSLITVGSHWRNPLTGGQAIDMTSFNYPDLYTPGNPIYTAFHTELDITAAGLQTLQNAGATVLFRPMHEMNGAWFWWSNGTPAQYKILWQHIFNYFTITKGLHNLLWVYGAMPYASCLDYYPGDGYVDIVGVSAYGMRGFSGTLTCYPEMTATGKPYALTEFGVQDTSGVGSSSDDLNFALLNIQNNMPKTVYFLTWSCYGNPSAGWCIQIDQNTTAALSNSWVQNRPVPYNGGTPPLPPPLNQSIAALMASPSSVSAAPGQVFNLTYNFQGGPTSTSLTAFVHFVNSAGAIAFQDSHLPPTPTNQWSGNISYTRSITVPAALPADNYKIFVGLYDPATGARSTLNMGPGVTTDGQLRYQVGTLSVGASPPPITMAPAAPRLVQIQ